MSIKEPDHGHDREPDNGPDDALDNGRAVARAPTGGALTSLRALEAALRNVDTASIARRSGLPMLLFKRDGGGTWMFGKKKTVVEDDSRWAVNPLTFKWGYICFGNSKKPDERLVSISKPKPEITELPDTGFEWQDEMTVEMKCVAGTDAGLEVVFKASTGGGTDACNDLLAAVKDRFESGQHDGNVSPIVCLKKDSYQHIEHGRVWFPVLVVIDWMPLDGQPPAASVAKPTSPASLPPIEQPRRRRVG